MADLVTDMRQPSITLRVLGTGNGVSHIYNGNPSSTCVVCVDSKPALVLDVGLGTVMSAQKLLGGLPSCIYVSHNHTDHAGELPVIIMQEGKKQRVRVTAAMEVMRRLLGFRLHELKSTGKALETLADLEAVVEGQPFEPVPELPELTMVAHKSQHSEYCCGAVLRYNGRSLMGWTADSGFNEELYERLSVAPVLLVDARQRSTPEHASFQEVHQWAAAHPDKVVYVTGYGAPEDAPAELHYPGFRVARAGACIELLGPRHSSAALPAGCLAQEDKQWELAACAP